MISSVTAVLVSAVPVVSFMESLRGSTQAEIWMKIPVYVGRGACLILLFVLAGCGSHESAGTLSVSCGGSTALAGARSIDVLGEPVNGQVTLSFPDPVNPDHRGTS